MPSSRQSGAILVSGLPMAAWASRNLAAVILNGAPPLRPRARAAAMPAFVRSMIRVRSNSAVCGAPHTAEFEADLIRLRTREGMAIARARGKLRGKKPKLSDKQQKELRRMHNTGEYAISDLAELFTVSRPTVYRTLKRQRPAT